MKKILVLIITFFIFFKAYSFDINQILPIKSSVIDKVGVLNNDQKLQLESQIEQLRKKYTVEILTLIIPTTDGEEISSLATDIGQKVGVGKKDKDNGLVLLIAINDRAWNIATGYGIEGVIPDLLAKRIGEKNFVLFKESKYFEGISGAISDFDKAFSGDESIISNQKENEMSPDEENILTLFLASLFTSFLILKSFLRKKKYTYFLLGTILSFIFVFLLNYIIFSSVIGIIETSIFWFFGYIVGLFGKFRAGGGGGSGSSSGGGFGGFGGGRFGGGGSSGKW